MAVATRLMWSLSLFVLSTGIFGASAQQEAKFVVLQTKIPGGLVTTQGTWNPMKVDIDRAEASISQIANLKAENTSIHIDHPEGYFRQYLPMRQGGRKLLYVNAFCDPPNYWRTQLVIVMDGGTASGKPCLIPLRIPIRT
ncbi:hypothetical protein GCM10011507_09270 [Edaphobacter acidisoli]|uniref:Uncharacterized protein n=1 Tax=Edaphobacter acidisoli TaxID=2040573 RepID=A0A916W212_9BACT|nr:hypothetical protein [Edaphobacter acidisoli]GGA59880.1 hypothetical protein GCM10011507_09270 [Edaphobacter acidisoli]